MDVLFLSTLPARGATVRLPAPQRKPEISIHAPREGSDLLPDKDKLQASKFLSTLPARGATCRPSWTPPVRGYFYPRSPRGERPSTNWELRFDAKFLSTLPARGATPAAPRW